ncbi:MAG: hypothetical protein HQL49_05905 [Gammaproteobacteria bacterium]|nr:hypothetical protein [Gammaproteobacteria bacterium]
MRNDPTILVIDTHQVFEFMHPTLQSRFPEGEIIHIPTHDEAVRFVRSNREADLIFLDWKHSGSGLIDAIRADLENHNTPLVIMTEAIRVGSIAEHFNHHDIYFLNKPFISVGILRVIDRVTHSIDQRRHQRLQPDRDYTIHICFENLCSADFDLIDISVEACLLRLPTEFSKNIHIYQHAHITIHLEGYHIELEGEVLRLCQDIEEQRDGSTIQLMLKFSRNSEARLEQLYSMVDELQLRWNAQAD